MTDSRQESIWFVYMVECSDGSLYTGATNDVDKRVKTHNLKKGAYYTSFRTPVVLKYIEQFASKPEALSREHAIKKISAQDKRELVASQEYIFNNN